MIYRIRSRSNQRVKDLIKKRDEYFFFEGEKLVNDILERGDAIAILIINENKEKQLNILAGAVIDDTWVVSETVLEKLSSLKEKPDFIAVLEAREKPVDFQQSQVIIGLDSIQDPANAGTVFRCGAAFGIDVIAFSGAGVSLTNTKFLRAAQDAFFDMNYQRFPDVEALIEAARQANPALKFYLTSSHFQGKALAPHEIGSRLKVMRKALNISQERMAANFGVSRTTYTNNEVGKTFPGLHVLKVLADSFDVSMDWLICSRGPMLYGDRMEQKQETGLGSVFGEVKELLEHMEHVPLLRHEVLSFFL